MKHISKQLFAILLVLNLLVLLIPLASYKKVNIKSCIDIKNSTVTNSGNLTSKSSEDKCYFVDPSNGNDKNDGLSKDKAFRTIERARDMVRKVNKNMKSDIYVYLLGGTYSVDKTIEFSSKDSGTNGFNIIYTSYQDEKPILSGGKIVNGWTLYNKELNIYKAHLNTDSIRQLYVNGVRAIRARSINLVDKVSGAPYKDTVFTVPLKIHYSDISRIKDFRDMEIVWISHWSQIMCRIATINTALYSGAKVDFKKEDPLVDVVFKKEESENKILYHHTQKTLYYYLENHLSFLDAEGEWYFDKRTKTIYYKPRSNENMSNIEVISAGNIETLITVSGTASEKVHNIKFSRLEFRYTDWKGPDTMGYISGQSGLYNISDFDSSYHTLPGMFEISQASDIVLEGNRFKNGGAIGIVTRSLSMNNSIIGNSVTNMAGGGIYAGISATWGSGYRTSMQDVISNNFVSQCGEVYRDSAGILLKFPQKAIVEHNEVCDLPAIGISFGFEWSYNERLTSDNKIRYNKIHNVVQLLDDAGGIYTLGMMKNTVIHDNYIFDIKPSQYQGTNPIAGIYLDNGSRYKTVKKNVIINCPMNFYALNQPNEDNRFINNYVMNQKETMVASGNTYTQNRVIGLDPTKWPAEAKRIACFAGITDQYRNIVP